MRKIVEKGEDSVDKLISESGMGLATDRIRLYGVWFRMHPPVANVQHSALSTQYSVAVDGSGMVRHGRLVTSVVSDLFRCLSVSYLWGTNLNVLILPHFLAWVAVGPCGSCSLAFLLGVITVSSMRFVGGHSGGESAVLAIRRSNY